MTIYHQERQAKITSRPKATLVVGLLALIFLFPTIKNAMNLGSGDSKCASWPSRQGEWYSVPPGLLTATADYPRMVDKSGIWAKPSFGLTKGWIYAVKTPDGPLAYWAVAEDEGLHRSRVYNSKRQLVEERFDSWMALNDEAMTLSLSATRSGLGANPANVNRMLTDKIRDSIAHCLGY